MKLWVIIVFLVMNTVSSLTVDRVIVSSDANPLYLDFWPVVAQTWKDIVGIKPTLALIATKDVVVDETIGDVVRFEPIPGVSNALYAQLIRLLLPAYFEDEVCIISDMDMIPLSKKFFVDAVKNIEDDCFVIYSKLPPLEEPLYLPSVAMCYIAAKGSLFKEIFELDAIKDIPTKITEWSNLNLGWFTDQILLYRYLASWPSCAKKCMGLEQCYQSNRVCRSNWQYDKHLLQDGLYRDAHLLRPYSTYKKEIQALVNALYNKDKNA